MSRFSISSMWFESTMPHYTPFFAEKEGDFIKNTAMTNKEYFIDKYEDYIPPQYAKEFRKDFNDAVIGSCGQANWVFQQETLDCKLYTTHDWLCADNDCPTLYVQKDYSRFELNCFSGMDGSSISICDITIYRFFKLAGIKDNDISFEQAALRVSDYLCSKFCEFNGKISS